MIVAFGNRITPHTLRHFYCRNVWKKYNGYAKGVHNLKQDEFAFTQEQGGLALF